MLFGTTLEQDCMKRVAEFRIENSNLEKYMDLYSLLNIGVQMQRNLLENH